MLPRGIGNHYCFKIPEKLWLSKLWADTTETCGPRYSSRGRCVQSFPSCFGKKGWVFASAALLPCCHGKEPFVSGSQKPWWLSQRDALGIQRLRQEWQNWWGHSLALPQESSVQKISCDGAWTGQTRGPFQKQWCLTQTRRSPVVKPLRGFHPALLWELFHRAGGQQSGPVFSIVKLCGECVGGFTFQCVLWAAQQRRGRIQPGYWP